MTKTKSKSDDKTKNKAKRQGQERLTSGWRRALRQLSRRQG